MELKARCLEQLVHGARRGICGLLVESQRPWDLSTFDRTQFECERTVVARVRLLDRPRVVSVVGVSSQPSEVGFDLTVRRRKLGTKGRIDATAADRLPFERLTVT